MNHQPLRKHHILQKHLGGEQSPELIKALLEALAREQDQEVQNEILTELIKKYVTLTKKLEAQIVTIATQNLQLAELHRQQNEFLGIAAHDLRNPITIIQMYAEMLLEILNQNLGEQQREFIREIYTASEFMLHLLENLLDLSKIEAGTLDLDRKPSDYLKLIERNVKLNRILAKKKNIRIQLQCEPALPVVSVDAKKIEQVLNNLLSNAIKFSHPETTITVCVHHAEGSIVTEVSDQGQGIPQSELAQIFKTFGKSSVRPTQGEKSTGLGLAIVKKIIERHQGRIGVTSEVGKGSTFYFSFPIN